jgi:opacity protein-like surface antigen
MKTLIALAIAAATMTSAYAADVAYAPNKAGGYITLTDDQSNCDSGTLFYYNTDQNGNRLDRGCYSISMPWIMATAYEGDKHRWAADGFTFTAYGNLKYGD